MAFFRKFEVNRMELLSENLQEIWADSTAFAAEHYFN